ncbi:MAG: TonB-dependent receptor, partial [Saprospiraceae bacterium]|nr:TonB-dependent receptor [Saprospiraceae bacterium]
MLNEEANDTEAKVFILERLPINTQWNYTNGLVYKNYQKNGYTSFVLSRNMLNNNAVKYFNNDESSPENLVLDYNSQEIENKLRVEQYQKNGVWESMAGLSYEFVKYNNRTNNKIFSGAGPEQINFSNAIQLHKYGFFGNISRKFFADKLNVTAGFRADGNSYSAEMRNPLQQFSPRISASYQVSEKWAINANVGKYYQLPPYTVLGYTRSRDGVLVNREN